MYTWNKEEILKTINVLKKLKPKDNDEKYEINYCIQELTKMIYKKDYTDTNISNENEEYKELKTYNRIINLIFDNYTFIPNQNFIEFQKIYIPKKRILDKTKETINNINKYWYNKLTPIFNSPYLLDYKKNNLNRFYYFDYIDQMYISLNKENTIDDYLSSIHEYMHALTVLINPMYLYNIEYEFLSILGELITIHEMKQKNYHTNEFIKADINQYLNITSLIKETETKIILTNSNLSKKEKLNFYKKELRLSKAQIKDIYDTSLNYSYSTIISYYLALELFDIYLKDKEKCCYIVEKIITRKTSFEQTLKDNNIKLLNNKEYIKRLKKEYATYNQ